MNSVVRKKEIALSIVKTLRAKSFQAYFAGGCVRDRLLGREPYDYDVATDASPDQIEKLFPDVIPVGKQFGVILAILEGMQFEIATFRTEGAYRDGRRPEWVKPGTPEEDASRRDFTINGLFYDPLENRSVDYVGGEEDLKKKVVRTIGDPNARFEEDKLRLLRAVRFAANLNFTVDPDTWRVLQERAPEIKVVSAERIREELIKIFTRPNAGRGLDLLSESGLLKEILPEVEALKGCHQDPEFHPEGDVFIHTKMLMDRLEAPSLVLAFSALLHDVGKPPAFSETDGEIHFYYHERLGGEISRNILTRLRFSNREIDSISGAVENHMRFMHVKEMRKGKLKMLIGRETFFDELELHRIDCEASHGMLDNYEFLKAKIQEYREEELKPKPLINGDDLISMGCRPGPNMGKLLTEMYELQLDGALKDKDAALAWARARWEELM
ncbi:MAG TPA: CCA tRNA nucleotidyltransferase [Candidatus Omnitrophota bacterium]|nr:CCA tRNA nucleotidyltransferase [Candidatus Omnitrophota bacterium]